MEFTRRELIKMGAMGAASMSVLGAMDLGIFVRQAIAAGHDPFPGIRNLAEPLFASPAMLTPDAKFNIGLKTAGSTLSNAAIISADGMKHALKFEQSDKGYTAALPSGAAPGVYHLRVTSTSDSGSAETETQPRAVAIYSEFKEDYDFVFFSDIHFGEHNEKFDKPVTPDMKEYYQLRARTLLEIESKNPEFVILGGDLVLYPKNYHFGYPEVYAFLLHYLKSPLHALPGNHDVYHMEVKERGGEHVHGKQYWEKYFGKYYHSFDYGNTHIACTNTTDWPDKYVHWGTHNTTTGTLLSVGIQKEQFMWLKNDLEAATGRGAEPIIMGHIPYHNIVSGGKFGLPPQKLPGASEKRIIGLLNKHNVKNIFVGHLHMNRVQELKGGITENMIRNVGGDFFESKKAGFAVIHVCGGKMDGYDLVDLKA